MIVEHPRYGTVPYVALWSGETELEGSGTPDVEGIVWARYTHAPGRGRPDFGGIHPGRQKHCMDLLLCQVCGGDADAPDEGGVPAWTWLITPRDDIRWGEHGWQVITGNPPTCTRCKPKAAARCAHMAAEGYAWLHVSMVLDWGLHGMLHGQGGGMVQLARGDLRIGRFTARARVAELAGVQVRDATGRMRRILADALPPVTGLARSQGH